MDAGAPVQFNAPFMTTDNHGVEQYDPSGILLSNGTRMSDLPTDHAVTALHALLHDTTTSDDEESNLELITLAAAAFVGDEPLATTPYRAVQVVAQTVLAYLRTCKASDGMQRLGNLRRAFLGGEIFLLLPAYPGAAHNQ